MYLVVSPLLKSNKKEIRVKRILFNNSIELYEIPYWLSENEVINKINGINQWTNYHIKTISDRILVLVIKITRYLY
jgi:hypothetical protein